MSYIVGVSSGLFGIARQQGPENAIQYLGLYKKAEYCITKGVEFIQIDLENVAEFQEPGLAEKMEKIKKMGITFGLHSEIAAFGGREETVPYLDIALRDEYYRGHARLEKVLIEGGKLGAKYVLLHSSEAPAFSLLGKQLENTLLVDYWGRPLSQFLRENPAIVDWAIKQKFVLEILREDYESHIRKRQVEAASFLREQKEKEKGYISDPKTGLLKSPAFSQEEIEKISEEAKIQGKRIAEEEMKNALIGFSDVSALSYAAEKVAYYVVAKYMESRNDPLWKPIINTSIEYYSTIDKKPREKWLKDKGIKSLSMDDINFVAEHKLWVPCVSSKYIWGHFSQEKRPGGKIPALADLKEIMKKHNVPFCLETPMVTSEEFSRLPNPLQMYYLVKEIDEKYIQLAIDTEHMLSSNVNPDTVFDLLPQDGGKMITVIHAGYPAVLAPAHIPIPLGSEQQLYLYKLYYKLRQKGMGKDNTCIMVFERGGGEDPIKQSVIALKLITQFLEKNTAPDKLSDEFFGIAPGQLMSMERQKVAVMEHALDPLKGMLSVPEEGHGLFSKSALEKGKGEEWRKERYK